MARSSKALVGRRKQEIMPTVEDDARMLINKVIRRVINAGGPDYRFPLLSGDEAAALMKVAGILDSKRNLGRKYH